MGMTIFLKELRDLMKLHGVEFRVSEWNAEYYVEVNNVGEDLDQAILDSRGCACVLPIKHDDITRAINRRIR